MKREEKIKYGLKVVNLLKLAKQRYTYDALSHMLNLSTTELSRYVKGRVLPCSERAKEMEKKLKKVVKIMFKNEVLRRIKLDMTELDKTNLVQDLSLLKFAAEDALMTFADTRITQVLPTGIYGIPLATLIAETIDVDVVVPTEMRRRGVEYYEVKYGEEYVRSLYVPQRMLSKKSSVLLVNDVIRYGYREESLIDLIYRIGAEVTGGYFLIAMGNEWEKRVKIPTKVVVRLY